MVKNILREALLAELESQDHTDGPVPDSERRGMGTMGLLWITMVTCFPCVLAGFTWYRDGLSLSQVVGNLLVSCLLIIVYSIPACYLGAKTGLTFALLSRFTFGRWGSRIVSFNSVWVAVGWYALNAIFLAEGLRGLCNLTVPHALFVAIIAVLMSANNFFGFSGVANFARWLAAPVLLAWVAVTFFKAAPAVPASVWTHAATASNGFALTTVSAFVLGIACWGNEADYWRYGKKKWYSSLPPLVVSLLIGEVLFPVTGWLMGKLFGITDYAGATKVMNDYVFGGFTFLSAACLVVSYIAVNDAGLYGAINAVENLKQIPRKICVGILAIAGALSGVLLLGYKNNFEAVASLSCIFLPCATMVMMADAFVVPRLFKVALPDYSKVPEYHELPPWRWAAVLSMSAGCLYGTVKSGFLPGMEQFAHGVPPVESWLVAFFTYLPLRWLELRLVCEAEPLPETESSLESEPSAVPVTLD